MLYTKNLQEKYNVDVFVAGGGAAGVAAAVAAARQGKSVFLAETSGCFGGLGTTGMVPAFAPFDDGVNVLASGIGYEIRKSVSSDIPLNSYWTPINTEELKRAYDKIVTDAGVRYSFFTTLCDVIVKDGHVESCVLNSKSGLFSVKAKIYVDATGDGDLCAFGGGEFTMGDDDGKVMPATLCSIWSGIEYERYKADKDYQDKFLEKAIEDGVFTQKDRHLPGFFVNKDGIGGANMGHIFDLDPTDETSLTKAMVFGRKLLLEYEKYYKEYLEGYENMSLCASAGILGVREARRILCDYTLNVEDFKSRAVFEDEIGRYCYPVDIHVANTDDEEYKRFLDEYYKTLRYKKGESYGIPYRSLVAKSFDNVLVAGRCMGTDKKMQASIRVMPGCFITGQGAGTAAALAAEYEDTRRVRYADLSKALLSLGAYLPNA